MEHKSLAIFVLTLIFLLASNTSEARNESQVPLIEIEHELVDSFKAIFASHAPKPKENYVAGDEASIVNSDVLNSAQGLLKDPSRSSSGGCDSLSPVEWPMLWVCPCHCEKDCAYWRTCCKMQTKLLQIKLELALIERSLESLPNATHIEVIVQTESGKPVRVSGEASLGMGNNTISRQLVQELCREREIQYQDSQYPTRRKYLVMTVLLGSDHRPFANQTFFILEPDQNYANSSIVIGSNLLNDSGAYRHPAKLTEHTVDAFDILVDIAGED